MQFLVVCKAPGRWLACIAVNSIGKAAWKSHHHAMACNGPIPHCIASHRSLVKDSAGEAHGLAATPLRQHSAQVKFGLIITPTISLAGRSLHLVLPTRETPWAPALQKALVSRSARLFLVPCRSGQKGSLGVTGSRRVVLSIYMRTLRRTEDPFLQLLYSQTTTLHITISKPFTACPAIRQHNTARPAGVACCLRRVLSSSSFLLERGVVSV